MLRMGLQTTHKGKRLTLYGGLFAACFDSQIIFQNQVFFILQTNPPYHYFKESIKYLLGLLNSKLIQFWLYHRGKKQGDQLQIDKEPLCNIPIHKINFDDPNEVEQHNRMVALVERMLSLHKREPLTPQEAERVQREISATDAAIDQLVYDLYGLTEEEIKIVEGNG